MLKSIFLIALGSVALAQLTRRPDVTIGLPVDPIEMPMDDGGDPVYEPCMFRYTVDPYEPNGSTIIIHNNLDFNLEAIDYDDCSSLLDIVSITDPPINYNAAALTCTIVTQRPSGPGSH